MKNYMKKVEQFVKNLSKNFCLADTSYSPQNCVTKHNKITAWPAGVALRGVGGGWILGVFLVHVCWSFLYEFYLLVRIVFL